LPEQVSEYVRANGPQGAATMCMLSNYQYPFEPEELEKLYGNLRSYRKAFEDRLNELEAEGWSLPIYHDMILADARAIEF
jgi:hypothetical protein